MPARHMELSIIQEKKKNGKKRVQWESAGCFSFYPGKNLGACGEGGAVTTNNEEIAQKIRMLRDHGQAKKYYHEFEGYNGRSGCHSDRDLTS